MAKIASIIPVVALACGCSNLPWAKPSASEMERLEQLLAGRPCIGELASWERRYRYGVHRDALIDDVDESKIHFQFFEAGVSTFVSDRWSDGVWEQMLYDGLAKKASGTFFPETGEVTISHCGANYPA